MPDKAPITKKTNEPTNQHRADPPARQSLVALIGQADPLALQRAIADPRAASPRDILALQRLAGNRAVTRLIQSKLTVGPAGDRYEQEADRVAEQVVGGQQSAVNRQAEDEEEIQTKPLAVSITPLVQRQAEEEEEVQTKPVVQAKPAVQRAPEEEEVQTKSNLESPISNPRSGFDAGPDLESRLASHQGGGSPLPDDVRAAMEPRFGADFGGVRVHTGGEADQLNRQLSAQAFTHGQDIYMGAGKYAPGTTAGNRLLAHELTHVIQQGGSTVKRIGRQMIQRTLIKEATRAFTTAGTRQHKDPTAAPDYVAPTYPQVKTLTDQLVPKADQESLIKLRSTGESWFSKSPEPEKKLKDVIRAFLLGQYAIRLDKLQHDDKLNTTQKKAKAKLYLEKDEMARDKHAALLKKGVAAPETQAFLNYQGFAGLVPVTGDQTRQELAKGPRIDVRATFIAMKVAGMNVRAHLFIVYTGSDGKQLYFRGGPGGPSGATRADMGAYTPNTVDWDPSAPSVTLLQGDAAKEKLDALIEATRIIVGMGVPYTGDKGENCNATAWTILTRAGITPQKPSGVHPGWGHILGSLTKGKENAMPAKEDVSSPGTPKAVKGAPTTSIQVYLDRDFVELGPKLKGGTLVDLLAGFGVDRAKIRYEGSKIGYVDATQLELPPVPGKSFKLRGETEVRKVGSSQVIATLSSGTAVLVTDLGYKLPKDASGEAVPIRYTDPRDGEKRDGEVSDWDLEEIK